jgi:prolyl-tRNA editing enzyme YbaK/EbsC (Cys-tRNA(Pro) deacylase)
VLVALQAEGLRDVEVRTFSERTATAAEAAAAIGASVNRIVKSLVFMAGDQPVLVLVSGPNRVDVAKVAGLTGQTVKRASADQVRALTGFSIGGVPPIGFAHPIRTLLDRDLLGFDQVWAAAGTPNSVFSIAPTVLARMTGAQPADLAQAESAS